MNIEEIKVSVLTLTDYEKKQIVNFIGSTSLSERVKICSRVYDDTVLSNLYDLLCDKNDTKY